VKELFNMAAAIQPVLYGEDEDDDVMLLKLAFKRAGVVHPLQVVTDGRQAVDYLWGNGCFADRAKYPLPCLVLLDLNLPQWDGFLVLQRIRGDVRFKDLPVLIFTSSEQPTDQTRARELGATEYIVKPSQVDRFVAFAKVLQEQWLHPRSRVNGG
jgi:two-component system, response regulator